MKKEKVGFILLTLMMVNCGNSPILNHKNAKSQSQNQGATPTGEKPTSNRSTKPKPVQKSECELEFKEASPQLCAAFSFDNNPRRDANQFVVGDAGNPFSIRFWRRDSDGQSKVIPIDPPASLHIVPMMLSMGHGSNRKTKVEKRADAKGSYQGVMVFNMGHPSDKWTIFVQLCNTEESTTKPCKPDNVMDEARFEVLVGETSD